MSRSLSLTAYLAYTRRSQGQPPEFTKSRPEGELVWAHAIDPTRADVLTHLADRLAHQRPGLKMLLTVPPNVTCRDRDSVIFEVLPEDSVVAAEAFQAHWRPNLCLWTGGDLQPAMISCAYSNGVPLFLIDVAEHLLIRPGWRWFPDLPRALLSRFTVIMTRDNATAQEVRRIGAGDAEIVVSGPLQEGAAALSFNKAVHEELTALLRGRQVWLAAMVQPEELEIVLEAHRTVSKLAHRTLLVIVPDNPGQRPWFRKKLSDGGWRFVTWSEEQMPGEATQILFADTRGELGLWYRLAATTLMASSLSQGQTGRDPNEPAAHGSAILYGPNVGRYLTIYSRYAEAGAARIVRNAETLSAAIMQLIAPDQSAAMAHAAWDVASKGAMVTDRVIDLVQDTLDVMETRG